VQETLKYLSIAVIGFVFVAFLIARTNGFKDSGANLATSDTRSDQEKIDSAAKQLAAAVANAPPVPIARQVATQVENEFSTLVHADPTLSELCIDLGRVRAAWIAAGVAPTAAAWGQTRDRACAFSSHGNVHLSTFKGSSDKSKQDFYDEITGLAF